ncbi:MAG: hydroxyacylglutathione hydrolase [Alphaproteobacteria bacterium]|nr:hydroxyacylglutathione hydrolase [Alphaproteobacteria bacterium]
MPLEILTIPCLSDNYAYAVCDTETGEVAVIDVPDATPILRTLAFKGWGLNQILITHHHDDHIAGLETLKAAIDAPVVGAKADMHRLPQLELGVEQGDVFALGNQTVCVYEVYGHTVGHVAYYFPEANALFTGDSLMVMGCGRLFEGDAETMWRSLTTLMELPPETRIYSGHEYTAANAKFALSVDPENKALIERTQRISEMRARGDDTMGSTLALEMATNPFLLAGNAEAFADIRKRKDAF